MSRLYTNYVIFAGDLNLEKLLEDVVPVFEVGIIQLKFEFDENVVVFVVHQAESVAF